MSDFKESGIRNNYTYCKSVYHIPKQSIPIHSVLEIGVYKSWGTEVVIGFIEIWKLKYIRGILNPSQEEKNTTQKNKERTLCYKKHQIAKCEHCFCPSYVPKRSGGTYRF